MQRVCVYCASSARIAPVYFEATQALAKLLVSEGIDVVFGGGSSGLMGQLADTVLAEGGRITGIMPHFMKEVEWAHKGLREIHFVADMHERKKRFLENVDGLIALPGGCGTFEELFEAMTLKRLGLFHQPIVILNVDGYYDPLKALLDRAIDEHFMSEKHGEMWTMVDQPEQVIPALRDAPAWGEGAISFATLK
jgi:hypothetical protein